MTTTQKAYFPGFATQLKAIRKKQRYSLALLAKEAGISRTYLWELEQDTEGRKSPSAYVIYQLSQLLQVDMPTLLGITENPSFFRAR